MATESKPTLDALAEWGRWFPAVAALIRERDEQLADLAQRHRAALDALAAGHAAELETVAAALATARNNAAAWFDEKDRYRAEMESAHRESAALRADRDGLAARVGELERKLTEYPDHPDVVAGTKRRLEADAAAIAAKLKALDKRG